MHTLYTLLLKQDFHTALRVFLIGEYTLPKRTLHTTWRVFVIGEYTLYTHYLKVLYAHCLRVFLIREHKLHTHYLKGLYTLAEEYFWLGNAHLIYLHTTQRWLLIGKCTLCNRTISILVSQTTHRRLLIVECTQPPEGHFWLKNAHFIHTT